MAYKHAHAVFDYAPTQLTPTERLTLLTLANYMGDENNAYPTVRQLASDTGTSERTITRCLKRLTQLGCIRIIKNAGGTENTPKQYRPNLYVWTLWENSTNAHPKAHKPEGAVDGETEIVTPTEATPRGDISGQNRGDISGEKLSTGVTPTANRGDTVGTHKSQLKPITPLTPQTQTPGQTQPRKPRTPRTQNPRRLIANVQAQKELDRLQKETNERLIRDWKNKHNIFSMLTDFTPVHLFENEPGKEYKFIAQAQKIIIQTQGQITPTQLRYDTCRALGLVDAVSAA